MFDFAFIDADKVSYPEYYEAVLARMRPGGLIVLDNVLAGGSIIEPDGEQSQATSELNDLIATDERVDIAMVGIADGLTLARKR